MGIISRNLLYIAVHGAGKALPSRRPALTLLPYVGIIMPTERQGSPKGALMRNSDGCLSNCNQWRFGILAAVGLWCVSASLAADASGRQVTFARDIAPIFQAKCEGCHRPGQMAPMALMTYEQVRPWAKAIRQRVATRQMPPWHMDPTVGIQSFQNDMSLSNAQISTILQWVDGGVPQGDPAEMPAPKQWPEDKGWQLA